MFNNNDTVLIKCFNMAANLHKKVNQSYDDLPYSFHLKLTASYAEKYMNLVLNEIENKDRQRKICYVLNLAAYFHDLIEDARVTYNDLVKLLKNECLPRNINCLHSMIADIVYACTNEKGKNRDERANDKYYEGIRTTSYAPFIKLCDRLANVRYSTLFDVNSKMAKVYKKEHEHFINQLTCLQSNPYISIMEEEMKVLLKDTEL